ncbi:MAG: T9SS type A sorting domain-containing protein [Bacteroidetes bacterium]|nr:T9SS type A sorting domain-containing protein [Bacteroidota bacterium]
MKKFLLAFFLIFSFTFLNAQNLVPNPSFEQYSNCPHLSQQDCLLSSVTSWYSAGYTPDYFNSCDSPSGSFECGTPQNFAGYQYPASGNGYAFIGTYAVMTYPNLREYLGTKLINPLEIGKKYFVSFKISRADRFVYCATNKVGALFSTVSYNLGSDSCNFSPGLLPHNFAHVYSTQIITDTANWTTITGSFIADSAYQYIIIGNHFDDNNTDTSICSNNNSESYYYIDDIYVSIDSTNGIEQNNVEQHISVYPTITDDIVFVQINVPTETNIKIYDLFGKLIVSQISLPSVKNKISLSKYDVGIYILSVNINNTTITKKIIKTK